MRTITVILLALSAIAAGGLITPAACQYNTTIRKVTISSPTAAALGKYGDIPVSYHTGIPNIEIPLYTIKSGPLQLPLGLSYHASGLRVEEQASWVGANWVLNAGGMITRTVMGAPDDKGLNAAFTTRGYFSDYGYNSYLFSVGPASCGPPPTPCPVGRAGMPASGYPSQDANILTGIFDGEPDLFFFNFNGYSGKFYFNDDRSAVIMPAQDLKITPIYTGSDWRGFTGFIITTPDGVQYYFGQNPHTDGNIDAIEVTYNVTTQTPFNGQGASSAWYLNKIVSADGQYSISLIYQAESYSYYTFSMYPIPAIPNPNFFSYNKEYDLNKNFITGVRLSRIVFANGQVDFTAGALRQDLGRGTGPFPNYTYGGIAELPNDDASWGGRTLGSISISAPDLCKKYSFGYSYFYDNSPITAPLLTVSYTGFNIQSDQYKLRLDNVQETSCDGTLSAPPYTFSYYPGTVARKLSFGIDHWGFYNGINSNTNLIPAYTITPANAMPGIVTNVAGADRDAHWPACRGGALQQINYPTGGATSFEYESNDVYTAIPVYTKTLRTTFSAGYSTSSVISNGTFTTGSGSNTYQLEMFSNQPSNQLGGNLEWTPGSANYHVEPGQQATYTFTLLPSTTYNYTFYDNNNSQQVSGYGVSANLYEYVPTTIYSNSQAGGLRIKTITSSDGLTAKNRVTAYSYNYNNTPGGQSSGQLYSRPVYVQAIRNDVWGLVTGAACSQNGCLTCASSDLAYYQSPASIRPMSSSQGNHIGYGEVYVTQTGNGYTRYTYYTSGGSIPHQWDPPANDVCVRTLTNLCDPAIPNTPAPPDPYDPMRGELAIKAEYSEGGQLLRSSSFMPLYQADSLVTPGIISRFFVTGYITANTAVDPSKLDPEHMTPSLNMVPVGVNTFTEYNLRSAKKIRDSVVTTLYSSATGNYITESKATYYKSYYHRQPTQTVSWSSKGEALVTNMKYAADFRISNFNTTDQLGVYYSNLYSDEVYLLNAMANINATMGPYDANYYWQRLYVHQSYRYMKAIDRQTYINWRRQNFTDPGNLYTTSHNTAKSAADAELKPVLELQDASQNPVIEQTTWKNNKLLRASYDRFDYVSNPSGKVFPNKTQLVNPTTPSATFSYAAVSGNTLAKDSRYQDETLTKFDRGHLDETTRKDGVVTSYIWDYNECYPIAQVAGAGSNAIAYTSFESNGSGGWTLSGSVLTGAAPTGAKVFSGTVSKSGLDAGTQYIVSCWAQSQPSASGAALTKTGRSYNGYTYYEFLTTAGAGAVSIGGGGQIDEIRLYPKGAQMITFTYGALTGITSQCDANNRVTYYEYDALSRLKQVKDQDGNIIQTTDYHYKQ